MTESENTTEAWEKKLSELEQLYVADARQLNDEKDRLAEQQRSLLTLQDKAMNSFKVFTNNRLTYAQGIINTQQERIKALLSQVEDLKRPGPGPRPNNLS